MSKLRRISFILMVLMSAVAFANDSAILRDPETLHYNVMFKWGLINKKAGTATLTLRHHNDDYVTQLTASSEPWADRIFMVRDTLNGRMAHADMRPSMYEKIAHEGGEVKHDLVEYDYSNPSHVVGHCKRRVVKDGQLTVDETRSMQAEKAVDMLTSFYFMRDLDFDNMMPGERTSIAIFSGKQKETLTIHYEGLDEVNIEGTVLPAYHVKFTFTSKGGKKTSDDMDAWIGTDVGRTPLKLEGKLPVGKVRCFLTAVE